MKRRQITSTLAIALGLLTIVAVTPLIAPLRAEELPRGEERWALFLPELAITANTTGKADFSLKGSLAKGLSTSGDLLLWPIVRVQTDDGIADLLRVDEGKGSPDPAPWRLGLAIGYVGFSVDEPVSLGRVHEAYREADRTCRRACKSGADDYCKTVRSTILDAKLKRKPADLSIELYCIEGRATYHHDLPDKREKALETANAACATSHGNAPQTDPSGLCAEGKKLYDDALAAFQATQFDMCWAKCTGIEPDGFCKLARIGEVHERLDSSQVCDEGKKLLRTLRDESALLPPFSISVGGLAGRDSFAYYSAASGPTELKKDTDKAWTVKAGVLATNVWSRWATLELGAAYERKVEASSRAIKWCTPKGNVARDDTTYDADNIATYDTAQECSEAKLGATGQSHAIELFGEYGFTAEDGQGWRLAFGPRLKIEEPDGKRSLRATSLSLGLPLYIDLYALPKEYGSYRGVLRITPAIEGYRDDDDELARRFAITLALLAQRTLFGSVVDGL